MDMLPPAPKGRPKKSPTAPSQPTTNAEPSPTQESSSGCLYKRPDWGEMEAIKDDGSNFVPVLSKLAVQTIKFMQYMGIELACSIQKEDESVAKARLTNSASKLLERSVTLASKTAGDFRDNLKKKKESVDAA